MLEAAKLIVRKTSSVDGPNGLSSGSGLENRLEIGDVQACSRLRL